MSAAPSAADALVCVASPSVTDDAGVEKALNTAVEELGALHFAVNTAGGGIAKKTISSSGPHPLDEFRRVIELNLVGTFKLNRLQAWLMRDNEPEDGERGVIVNTASIAAFEGQIGQVAYTSAKPASQEWCSPWRGTSVPTASA